MYLCTVHAKSIMNHACVMFCPCPPPLFKVNVSEILYRVFKKKVSFTLESLEHLRNEVGIKVRGKESAGADFFGKYHNIKNV